MRRSPLAETLADAQRSEVAALPPGERVLLALELGRRSLASYCAKSGLALAQAIEAREVRKQQRRRPSACLEARRGESPRSGE